MSTSVLPQRAPGAVRHRRGVTTRQQPDGRQCASAERALARVLQDFGPAVGQEPQRLRALLHDALGGDDAATSAAAEALVAAAAAGAGHRVAIDRSADSVRWSTALITGDEGLAAWAVQVWHRVHHRSAPTARTRPPSTDPAPVTLPQPRPGTAPPAVRPRRRVVGVLAGTVVLIAAPVAGLAVGAHYVFSVTTAAAGTPTPSVHPTVTDARRGAEAPSFAPVRNEAYAAVSHYSLTGDFLYWDIWLVDDAYVTDDGRWQIAEASAAHGTVEVIACPERSSHGCLRYTPADDTVTGDTITYRVADDLQNLSAPAALVVTIARSAA